MLNIAILGDAVVSNINKIAAQLGALPSTVDGTAGTTSGLGSGFGQSLQNTGTELQNTLAQLVWAMTQHQASIRAAVQALADADEISSEDASQILKTIDETVSQSKTTEAPAAPGADVTSTASSDTVGM